MNMQTKRIHGSPVSGTDTLAALERRLSELDRRREAITAKLLSAERSSSIGRQLREASSNRAVALLEGTPAEELPDRLEPEILALRNERDLIDRALEIGRSRHFQLAAERAGEIWSSFFDQIKAIETERMKAAYKLQKINRDREALRETIRKAGGGPFLPLDNFELCGIGDHHDETFEAAERLIAQGFVTRADLEKSRRD